MLLTKKHPTSKFLSHWDSSYKPPCSVVTCFLQAEDKFLVLQRAREDIQYGLWGIPGGKLQDGEEPRIGMTRELYEETGIHFSASNLILMNSAISHTDCDGEYGLYLFYAITKNKKIILNPSEHLAFKWVSLDEFIKLPLLHAQLDAFKWVADELATLVCEKVNE